MSVKKETGKNADDSEHSPKDIARGIKLLVGIGAALWIVLILVAILHPGITARVKFAADCKRKATTATKHSLGVSFHRSS